MSEKQKQALEFIHAFIQEHGYPPTLREIADHFETTVQPVFERIQVLIHEAYIFRGQTATRYIRINWDRVGFNSDGKVFERLPL